MGRPKGSVNKKVEDSDDLQEIDEALKEETGVESHPDFDPSLPESKQRDTR